MVTDGAPGMMRTAEECFPLVLRQRCRPSVAQLDNSAMRYLVYEPTDSGTREIGQKLIQAVCSVSDRVHRIVVPKNGNGELVYRLMGEDDHLYSFAISQCHIAYVARRSHCLSDDVLT